MTGLSSSAKTDLAKSKQEPSRSNLTRPQGRLTELERAKVGVCACSLSPPAPVAKASRPVWGNVIIASSDDAALPPSDGLAPRYSVENVMEFTTFPSGKGAQRRCRVHRESCGSRRRRTPRRSACRHAPLGFEIFQDPILDADGTGPSS